MDQGELESLARFYGPTLAPARPAGARAPGEGGPGEGTSAESIARYGTPVALSEFSFQARESQAVSLTDQANIPSGSFADLFNFVVPYGRELRIRWMGFTATDPTALAYLEHSFRADGAELPGLNLMPVALGLIHQPFEVGLRVEGGHTLAVRLFNRMFSVIEPPAVTCHLRGWLMNEVR